MSSPIALEPAVGVVDGVNDTFTVTSSYATGTLRVFSNGIIKQVDDLDGWIELGGNSFQMKEAPLAGDRLMAYYRPI